MSAVQCGAAPMRRGMPAADPRTPIEDHPALLCATHRNGARSQAAGPSWAVQARVIRTDGYRVGMCVRCAGWTTTGAGNNNRNYTITALTATVMSVAETVAAKASDLTLTVAGHMDPVLARRGCVSC